MKDDSLPTLLPYQTISNGLLDMRGSGILQGYSITGPSPESYTPHEVAALSRQLAAAFTHLGSGDCVQVVYQRCPASAPPLNEDSPKSAIAMVEAERRAHFDAQDYWLSEGRLYLSHRYPSAAKGWLDGLFADLGERHQVRNELLCESALNRFTAFVTAASTGIGMTRLNDEELFRSLLADVVYHTYPALLPGSGVRLNELIGCEPFTGGYTPSLNGFHLRPLCITAYPSVTVPQILAVLLRQKGYLTISARFICMDVWEAQQVLKAEMQHWNRQIIGTFADMIKNWMGQKRQQTDQDSATQIADLNDALAACAQGITFGYSTIVAIVRDVDPDRTTLRAQELLRECHAMGVMARIEDLNAVEAIIGSWPGNTTANVRRPLITAQNFADVVLPCTYWRGN